MATAIRSQNRIDDATEMIEGPGFADAFQYSGAVGTGRGKIAPEPFNPVKDMSRAGKTLTIGVEQVVMKGLEAGCTGNHDLPAGLNRFGQKRIGDDAASQHPSIDSRKSVGNFLKSFQIINIAVVNHGMIDGSLTFVECIQIDRSGVHLRLDR